MITKEIVVARYKEDLKWVLDVPDDVKVTVYSKDRRAIRPEILERIDKIKRMPNIGRESHTYLTHIVNNYDTLSDITVFVQGEPRPHGYGYRWDLYLDIDTDKPSASMKLDSNESSNRYTNWDHIPRMLKWKNFTRSELTFKKWWEKYLNLEVPDKDEFRCSFGACFSVSKKYVLSHSKKYYRKLLTTVSNERDPEEGHFLERAWSYIFNPNKINR